MSRLNKVNKGNYDQGGRLTPDEMARERKKMMPNPVNQERVTGNAPEPRRGERVSSQDRSEREESA
jgi:hypothetical protein